MTQKSYRRRKIWFLRVALRHLSLGVGWNENYVCWGRGDGGFWQVLWQVFHT
jgi:hypothetical protein